MAKEELMQFEGLVLEALPDTRFKVQLDSGHEIIAYTAGKMKKNRIKTLAGDRVTVEMSPYDLEKGRLVFRHKDERASKDAPCRYRAPPPVRASRLAPLAPQHEGSGDASLILVTAAGRGCRPRRGRRTGCGRPPRGASPDRRNSPNSRPRTSCAGS